MSLKKEIYCQSLGCKMGFALKGILKLMKKGFEKQGIKLTIEQFFILNILENKQGLILQELAEIVDKDKSAVLRHIDNLEENHFTARATDPEDKRRKILLVTRPGLEVLKKARKVEKEINEEITQHLTNKELKKFEKTISDIYEYTTT